MRWRRFFRRTQWDRERLAEVESYLNIETSEGRVNRCETLLACLAESLSGLVYCYDLRN